MILGENVSNVYSKGKEIQRVFSKGKLVWEKEKNYNNIPFTVKAIDDRVKVGVGFYQISTLPYKVSINGGEWKETSGFNIIHKDDTVSIKANSAYSVAITGLSDVYGNIASLIKGDNFTDLSTFAGAENLLSDCDIRSAENLILPVPTSSSPSYKQMFMNCKYLTIAPKLPATKLSTACYQYMFYGCSSLIKAPELPATTLATNCYSSMFYGCSSLVVPPELPATKLAPDCYLSMFNGCSSLIKAPELPATTLARGCYNYMFRNCSNLNYIKCYARAAASNSEPEYSLKNWTEGVSPTGIFVCDRYYYTNLKPYIPSTWTVEYLN